jgi:predicted MPP superfamily phosphohydrolase
VTDNADHHRKRRRAAIRHAVLTRPSIRLLKGRLASFAPGQHFHINQRTIDIPDLPDELCGLTIAHLSDPHIGELITPDHLPAIVQATNALACDLIAVTGDFVDFSIDCLPAVVDAMARLEAPLGAWFVLGNHDYLDNPTQLKHAFYEAGLNLLLNESVRIEHKDRLIALGGIDWTSQPAALRKFVAGTASHMHPSDLRILLAHHPHAFDTACACDIQLTLSGHTHGGQVVVANNRNGGRGIGLGGLGFRYSRGLYSRGPHRLFVSTGVGSWFPLRVNCPAEITRLELQTTF